MPRALRTRRHPPRAAERGAALLLAVVSVAILTALAVDLTYETQVRLRTATNARDELRAQALAQSAVTMSRLVLSFQAALDKTSTAVNAAQQSVSGTQGGATPTAAFPRVQVWNLVPVGSELTQRLFGDAGGSKAETPPAPAQAGAAPAVATTSLADFQGGFEARIEDEGQKVNVQLDSLNTSGVLAPQVESLLRMMCEAKWDPLFDHTDADGQRYSRSDLVVHLRDWANAENNSSALAASFPCGNCSFVVERSPFEKAFSDKNYPYDRGPDRYRVKNARFDSLDELHLVAGISDAWMAAFGDQLTVYLPQNAQYNVNTTDPALQLRIAALMADPASVTKLLDPAFQAAFRKALSVTTMGGFVSITPVQFAQLLGAQGVKVRSEYLTQSTTSPFTDKSVAYRIRAFGVAGDVSHEIDAVVTYDPRLNALQLPPGMGGPQNQPDLGTLIHWRED
jgi:general secretion pathway protein K